MRLKTTLSALLAGAFIATAPLVAQSGTAADEGKRRVILLTDIGNEPDDAESFVRFLLYSNQFDVEALIATTSTWQRTRVQPQLLRERIDTYGKVLPNLRAHAQGYVEASQLAATVRSGSAVYGMQGVGPASDKHNEYMSSFVLL